MYHALLTNRYLTTRVIPLIAVAAVGLCVALVIIVVSVMTGFLDMVKDSGRTLIGDVVVSYQLSGIPHYDRLIEHLTALDEVAAASPVVEGWGLIQMPFPDGPQKDSRTVQVWGVEPESFAAVTGFNDAIYWTELNERQRELLIDDLISRQGGEFAASLSQQLKLALLDQVIGRGDDVWRAELSPQAVADHIESITADQWEAVLVSLPMPEVMIPEIVGDDRWLELLQHDPRLIDDQQIVEDATSLTASAVAPGYPDNLPAAVLGVHVSGANQRGEDGEVVPSRDWHWWMPRYSVAITTLPVIAGGFAPEPETRRFQIVNEFASGVFIIDETRVVVPLDIAQAMLHLDEATEVDPNDPTQIIGTIPARATSILVRAEPGTSPEALKVLVADAYKAFVRDVEDDMSITTLPPRLRTDTHSGATVQTWQEQNARFLGPIEKERELMRTLFSIVYLVCAGLVLAIFWSIVHEKTRDIGILRSIGASRLGISWIFLRYAIFVGFIGSLLGLGLAYLIVHNINTIHNAIGNPPMWLPLTFLAAAFAALAVTAIRARSGRLLPVVGGSLLIIALGLVGVGLLYLRHIGGVLIWDPSVYYFSRIPNDIDMTTAFITIVGAVIFCLIGAFIPAARAADTDPVTALRYE